jgi:hypothetical protein
MPLQAHLANPFAMLLNAEAVLHEMHCSESLEKLAHQVHHPLDKVIKARKPAELEDFDATVDAAIEELPPETELPADVHAGFDDLDPASPHH